MAILKQKYLIPFLTCIALGLGLFLWSPFSTGYYSCSTITYDKQGQPLITVKLKNCNQLLKVRIGSRFPLFLTKEALAGIDKQLHGSAVVHNINGESYEVPSYLIPEIKIGDLTLRNMLANEGEGQGVLGKFLGGEFNLLLDFPHSRIIACDTFSKLQAKNLTSNNWISIPFELTAGGITLQASTDFGASKLAINTTSTESLISSSLVPFKKNLVLTSLSMGEQEFGLTTFCPIDLPEGLSDIDGFIGMDFLKKHAIYFDYSTKTAYIQPPEIYLERLPVTFDSRGIPTIDVLIEKKTYLLEVDLGCRFSFILKSEILQSIQKTSYGTAEWSDYRGNKYESPAFTIPEIKIGTLTFTDTIAPQDSDDFHSNVTSTTLTSQPLGSIGIPLLEKCNLLLDFRHFAIYAGNTYQYLQKAGILSRNLLKIPFDRHPDGILLSVETDDGLRRLLLDTGATHTAIRAPFPGSTAKFSLMGRDFGARSIFSIELNPNCNYDGYLGLDFLREYSVFIDYPNKLIYLDLQKDI